MLLPTYIKELLHRIAETENFTDYKLETEAGSKHGDNFLGVMIAVTISGLRNQNGKSITDKLHLLCKIPPSNLSRRKNFRSDLVFARELYVYTKLLPKFVEFQKSKGLTDAESFISFPKVYASECDHQTGTYILIMGDLRLEGYQMWPREDTIRVDHELAIMRELGKFHACSFAMKDQHPNEFNEFKQLKDTFKELGLAAFNYESINRAAKAMRDPFHKRILENFRETYSVTLEKCFSQRTSERFGVIGHGDPWINNFLFRYSDEQKETLESVCFLDWQITRYCSPVLDLLYNIFGCTDHAFRKKNYEKLILAYHSSLSDTIQKLGSDPEKLFTYDDLQSELRYLGDFALLTGPFIAQIIVANAKDIGNLDDYSERIVNGEMVDLLSKFDDCTQKKYDDIANGIVTDLIDYGYIEDQINKNL